MHGNDQSSFRPAAPHLSKPHDKHQTPCFSSRLPDFPAPKGGKTPKWTLHPPFKAFSPPPVFSFTPYFAGVITEVKNKFRYQDYTGLFFSPIA